MSLAEPALSEAHAAEALRLSPDCPDGAADPSAHAAAVTAAAGTSFAAGMRILPRRRRAGMHALYAFARLIDDVADGDLPLAEKRALLDAWAGEVERIRAGRPRSVVGRALLDPIARYDLPADELALMVEGMRMDAEGPVVAPSEATLAAYVRRVAGTVGLLSMRIFGAWRGAPSERFALALAEALQTVNILRDVEEDAAIGRLYLPREALDRHGAPATPREAVLSPALPAVCADLGARARARFAEARAEFAAHDRLRLAPALMMMGPYEGYLALMERAAWRRDAPFRLAGGRKLLLGVRCVLSHRA